MSGVLRFTILGCGSSGGVPRIDGEWGACDPRNPRNRRSRSSILVERRRAEDPWGPETTTRVLVDTSPDMRLQLLAAGVTGLDAVLLTHDHADQTHGLDDLRAFWATTRRRMPVHMDAPTAETMLARFGYVFTPPEGSPYPAIAEAVIDLTAGEAIRIEGAGGAIEALVLDQDHGFARSLGFRFGRAAYSNDVVELPETTRAALRDLEVWIVDALQDAPHRTHAHVAKTLGWIEELAPQRAILTNLHHTLDYAELNARTPAHVSPGYDGLQIEVED